MKVAATALTSIAVKREDEIEAGIYDSGRPAMRLRCSEVRGGAARQIQTPAGCPSTGVCRVFQCSRSAVASDDRDIICDKSVPRCEDKRIGSPHFLLRMLLISYTKRTD
jgi:hypothetical protein